MKISLDGFGFRSIGQVGHFVGITVKVIADILRIPNVFVALVANGTHFEVIAVVTIVNIISQLIVPN